MTTDNIQLDSQGRLKHFLTTEHLPRSLLTAILDNAERFTVVGEPLSFTLVVAPRAAALVGVAAFCPLACVVCTASAT